MLLNMEAMHATMTHQLRLYFKWVGQCFLYLLYYLKMSCQVISFLTNMFLDNCFNQCDGSVDSVCRSQPPSAAEIEAALPLLHKVPYSLHSSYSELESFVAHLRPEAIVPIVKKCYDSRYPIDPNVHFKHLLGRPVPVDAQQHGQTCGRGRKRKVHGRAKREDGANEKGDCCWQHGKWQVCPCCLLPWSLCRVIILMCFKHKEHSTELCARWSWPAVQSTKLCMVLKCQL